MSRIGKLPIAVPSGVTATVEGQNVKIKNMQKVLEVLRNNQVNALT